MVAALIAQLLTLKPLPVRPVGAIDMGLLTEPDVPVAPAKLNVGTGTFTVKLTVTALDEPAALVATKV